MRNLFKSLVYAIGFSITINLAVKYDLIGLIKDMIEYGWVYTFREVIMMGVYIFFILFCIATILFFAIKSIWHIILFNYNLFFYEKREGQINVTVDENYIIRDSFVELFDGTTIPIKIRKIVMGKPEEEKEE